MFLRDSTCMFTLTLEQALLYLYFYFNKLMCILMLQLVRCLKLIKTLKNEILYSSFSVLATLSKSQFLCF